MEPLRITATIGGAICIPGAPPSIDGLLAYAVCIRDAIPPAFSEADMVPVEIPIQREPGGRFHLASFAEYEPEERELHYTNKRPTIAETQTLGKRTGRMNIAAGPDKGYHIPREHIHLVDDRLTWWCIGDAREIRSLLALIHGIGKKRGVGLGKVREWRVEPCEPWGDGFPVARDGVPLRNLPLDWPELVNAETSYATITYPYHLGTREELCAVPPPRY